MSIIVGKKWDLGAQYIGRGSPLGNPFVMKDKSDAERNRVCDAYERYIVEEIQDGNEEIIMELIKLHELYEESGRLVLGCFCAPKRCHGDTIKRIIENL